MYLGRDITPLTILLMGVPPPGLHSMDVTKEALLGGSLHPAHEVKCLLRLNRKNNGYVVDALGAPLFHGTGSANTSLIQSDPSRIVWFPLVNRVQAR